MLVLTGPSASGKTEIAKLLIEKYNMKKLITYTTRSMRVGEKNGIDYHFITEAEFLKMKENEEFSETTFYNGYYYGTRKQDITFDKVVILDPSGVNHFSRTMRDKVVTVFLDTPEPIRKERMMARHDIPELIEKRLKNDREVFHKGSYGNINYVVKNTDVDLLHLAQIIYHFYSKHQKDSR